MARTEIGDGIFVKIGADLTGLSSGLNQAADMLSDFGDKMSEIGTNLSTYLTVPIAAMGTAIAKFGMDFEKSFAKISTMFDETQISSANLQDKLLQLSDSANIASNELNEGLYEALSSGIPITGDASDALGFMEKTIKLAKAGFTELGVAVDVDTSIMNAYGMGLEEVDRIHNTLIVTQNLGKTTVDQLGRTLSNVIPTAANLGVSIEQVGAAFAAMTAQGVPTAQASTQIKMALSELSKSGTKADEAFRGLAGQSFKQFIAAGGTMQQAFQLMTDGAKKSGLEINDMFSSVDAANAALILVSNTGSKNFITALETMRTETGAVDEAFKKVTDTTGERWSSAFNQMKNAAIRFFDAIAPGLEVLASVISYTAKYLSSFDEETQKIVVIFGALLAAIGPVTAAIGAVASAIAAIGAPVTIAIAGITALVAALAGIYKTNEAFKKAVDEIIDLLGQLGKKLYGIGQDVMEGLINGIESMLSALTPVVTSIAEAIISILKSVLGIASPSKEAEKVGENVGDGLVEGMDSSQGAVSGSAKELAKTIKKELKDNLDKVEDFGKAIEQALKNSYEKAYEAAKEQSDNTLRVAEDEYERKRDLIDKGLDNSLEAYDKQKEAVKDTVDSNIKEYEREYREKKRNLEDETNAYIKGLQEQKEAASDKVDNASDKAQDLKYENRKKKLRSDLSKWGTSFADLSETQAKLDELEAERDIELEKRKAKAEKKSIQDRIEAAREKLKEDKEILEDEKRDKVDAEREKEKEYSRWIDKQKDDLREAVEATKKEYARDYENFKEYQNQKIDALQKYYKALSDDAGLEAQKMLVEGNQQDILNLLEKYYPGWQNAGQKYGEALVDGLNSQKESADQAVNNLLNLKDTIAKQEAQLEELKKGKGVTAGGNTDTKTDSSDKNSLSDSLKSISDAVKPVSDTIKEVKEDIKQASETVNNAKTSFESFFNSITQNIPGLQGIGEWFKNLSSSILPAFQRIMDSLSQTSLPLLRQIFDYINNTALPVITAALQNFSNTILPPLIEVIKTAISSISDVLMKVFQFVTVELLPVILTNIQTWLPTITEIIKGLVGIISIVMADILKVVNAGLQLTKQAFDLMWPYIQVLTKTTFENLVPIVDVALKAVNLIIQTILAALKGDWKTVYDSLGEIAKGAIEAASGVIGTALGTIATVIKSFLEQLKEKWDDTWMGLGDTIIDVWDGIITTVQNALSTINDSITGLINRIKDAINWLDQLKNKQNNPGTGTGAGKGGSDERNPFGVPDYLTTGGSGAAKNTVANSTTNNNNDNSKTEFHLNINGDQKDNGNIPEEVIEASRTMMNWATASKLRSNK
ncbi:MAG TPA: phage tail tape measure protein [Petrotogaceae bacterium]|nr:phage tail tape measure protein [Petrotogaceae bacterium]